MARFEHDPNRLNYTVEQSGKEYNERLLVRSQAVFSTLLDLLPSNYISTVQGPNYTNELKAIAVEISRIELALEDIASDRDVNKTRGEFLYSILGYLVFLNAKLPSMSFDDEEFRRFVLNLIRVYFQGSIPKSLRSVTEMLLDENVKLKENYALIRQGVSGLDISDQWGFQIDVEIPEGGSLPQDVFESNEILRVILDVIRPSHTLYRLRHIFKDTYTPNDEFGRVMDTMKWSLADYHYDDFRSYWDGIRDKDRLGKKENQYVEGEDHSNDF